MATQSETDPEQPTEDGVPSQLDSPCDSQAQSAGGSAPRHGSTGEGAGSAMARLISQEQARVLPGAPDPTPSEPS
jgi:hypothetical protein